MKNFSDCVCVMNLTHLVLGKNFLFRKGEKFRFKSYGKSYYEMFNDRCWLGYLSAGMFSKHFELRDMFLEDLDKQFNIIMDGGI